MYHLLDPYHHVDCLELRDSSVDDMDDVDLIPRDLE